MFETDVTFSFVRVFSTDVPSNNINSPGTFVDLFPSVVYLISRSNEIYINARFVNNAIDYIPMASIP